MDPDTAVTRRDSGSEISPKGRMANSQACQNTPPVQQNEANLTVRPYKIKTRTNEKMMKRKEETLKRIHGCVGFIIPGGPEGV